MDVVWYRLVCGCRYNYTLHHCTCMFSFALIVVQEDVVCLLCSSGDGMKRGYLAAEGFGSQYCYLEAEAREQVNM